MLREFSLYDLSVLCFMQLLLATVLVLSPARDFGTRFRWTGSKVTEVLPGALVAVALAALSCFLTAELWGLPASDLETAAYLLAIFCVVVIVLRPDCGVVGQVFYASYAAAGFTFIAFAALIAVSGTHSIAEGVTASLVLLLDLAAFLVWNSNMNYVSDVLARSRHSRLPPVVDPSHQPMVSLHIPAYNEPPDLLINTIKAVEAIDYPNFEVVVIDNNTPDPAVWSPVEEYCRDRERVRFVHVAPWPGYKAGACNLALRRYTDPRAEIIGLVDADDIVKPYYLRETVPYFSDPNLGFIQTFEGNRDYQGSAYYTACVDSYQAFYLSVMSSRNERDSVPFVGTMGLFRRSALLGIGGWNEWCISEDTEASLRVHKAGWSGLYIPRCFGRGVVPPTYAGLNTQRHRWCFGAMQIFRLHWRSLMPWDRSPDNHLTSGQRRDYLMASMGWTRDLLMATFAIILLLIAALRLAGSRFAVIPLGGDKAVLPMSLILVATLCMTWTLRHWTTISIRRALLGLLISLSASFVTARACIEGLTRRDGVFLRTSKTGSSHHRLRKAFRLCRWEFLFAVSLYAAAAYLVTTPKPPWLLVAIIFLQGTVYLCAPIASFWNLRTQRVPELEFRRRFEQQQIRQTTRPRPSYRLLGLAAVVVLALGIGGMTGAFVAPVTLLRAEAVKPRTGQVRTLLTSNPTEAFVKLGSAPSDQASYYPVTSVRLLQTSSSTPRSPARFSLSFDTSSLALLVEVLRDDGLAREISGLTLVVRTPHQKGRHATTEVTDTFDRAVVTSFAGSLSGPSAGSVTLTAQAHELASPSAGTSSPPAQVTASSSPIATDASVTLGSASSTQAYYNVTSVELSQSSPSSARSPGRFSLSFDTSSGVLLDEVLRADGPGKEISTLILVVRNPARGRRLAVTEMTNTFDKAVVTSFDGSLTGSPPARVTLSLQY